MSEETDHELMARLARGEMDALGVLVDRHQGKALGLAYRMSGRWDIAEDAAQEAFLRVHAAAPTYRPDAKFTTWLYRTVVNLCLDEKRKAARGGTASKLLSSIQAASEPDRMENEERVAAVRKAVAALPERQRTVLILHRYQELTHHEIVEITGWSASAVESLLVRAYASLRQSLAQWHVR